MNTAYTTVVIIPNLRFSFHPLIATPNSRYTTVANKLIPVNTKVLLLIMMILSLARVEMNQGSPRQSRMSKMLLPTVLETAISPKPKRKENLIYTVLLGMNCNSDSFHILSNLLPLESYLVKVNCFKSLVSVELSQCDSFHILLNLVSSVSYLV